MVLLSKAYGKLASLSRENVIILISVLMRGHGKMVGLKAKAKELGKINADMRASFLQENHVELGPNFIQMEKKL